MIEEKMIDTIEPITSLVQGTCLAGKQIMQLEIPETSDRAFALEVDLANGLDAWRVMRNYLDETKRYPVLVTCWINSSTNWEQNVLDSDLFSRFYFQEEAEQISERGTSPKSIIASANSVDIPNWLSDRAKFFTDDLAAEVDYILQDIEQRFGIAPTKSEVKALIDTKQISTRMELEKWLFMWELEHISSEQRLASPDLSYLSWYEPREQSMALILLPTVNSWDALAYLHWYGGCAAGSDVAIALLRQWQQHYGAELVCHYGTMLQFDVESIPPTPEAAFTLAWEQEALAPCTTMLSGISLRDHARSLLYTHQWFLHERP